METLELQAKTIDEAKQAAAKQLGVAVDQIDLKVIEETAGLFGKKKMKVEVTVIDKDAKAPAKPARAKKSPAKAEPEPEPAPEKAVVESAASAEKPKRTSRASSKSAKEEKPAKAEEPKPDAPAEPEVIATEADADEIMEIVGEILDFADFDVDITLKSLTGKYVNLELAGKDAAHVIGKHGEVINSLQYLSNLVISKKVASGARVSIDGNNYRQRREETLTKLAQEVAEEVLKRGEEAVFDSLPAFERRIVHKALSEYEGVTTYSEGEEPNRHVVIAPTK